MAESHYDKLPLLAEGCVKCDIANQDVRFRSNKNLGWMKLKSILESRVIQLLRN